MSDMTRTGCDPRLSSNILTKVFPADNSREVEVSITVNGSNDAALKVHGPAFIQPAKVVQTGVSSHANCLLFWETYKCSQLQLVTKLPLQL